MSSTTTAPERVETEAPEKTWSGQSIPRKEDRRLVQGQGVFVDDVKRHGMGYVHFVRSPYAHAHITSIDVSQAEQAPGVYGTLTGEEVAALTDPFFQLSTPPGAHLKDYALAVGKVRFVGEPIVAVVADTRERARDASELVEVEYEPLDAVTDARRAQDADDAGAARRCGVEPDVGGRLRMGRPRRGVRRGRPDREDLRAALPPLQLDTARVRRRPRRVQPRRRAVDDHDEQPVPRVRRDHDGARDALRPRQAALRHAGHRRRLRQQDHLPPAAGRLLPARAQAQSRDPVDGVAHRLPPLDVARQRALVPRHRGRGEGRRDDARLPHEGARRRGSVAALRAARRCDLGTGDARHVPLAEHPPRVHAGGDEQGAGVAEPRLLAHAAPLVHRARDRHRRARARARSRRGAQAQLHPRGRDALRDAERLRLRLGRLRSHARHRARPDRLRRSRGAPSGCRRAGQAARLRHRIDPRLRDEQLRAVADDQSGAAVLGQQRGRHGEARHLRRDRGDPRHDAAGTGTRDDRGPGRRRHSQVLRRRRARPGRP